MIQFNKINVSGEYSTDFLFIEFGIEDTTEDLDNYIFNVYRSNDWNNEFQLQGSNVQNFEFIDTDVNLLHPDIIYCYKIEAIDNTTNKSVFSEVGSYSGSPPDAFFGYNYIHWLQWTYNKYLDIVINNDKCYLLRKKRTGSRCSECWDPIRKTPQKSRCQKCYEVGYTGGYYPPVTLCINWEVPWSNTEGASVSGVVNQDSSLQAWTSSFPRLQPGDIIVGSDQNAQRFKIMSVNTTKRKEYISRQIFQLQALPSADIVYKIAIDPTKVQSLSINHEDSPITYGSR